MNTASCACTDIIVLDLVLIWVMCCDAVLVHQILAEVGKEENNNLKKEDTVTGEEGFWKRQ